MHTIKPIVLHTKWIFKSLPPIGETQALSQVLNINTIASTILWQRGIRDYDQAKKFFRPSVDHLPDPFLMKDMDKAIERIRKAIDEHEKILIFGDYDVDGTTSVALVYSYFNKINANCAYYVPDRYSEGYGISTKGIEWANQNNCSLIIALDLGIKSFEKVDMAKDFGIDLIICDHHLPDATIPNAVAVLDPKRPDCPYPYKELSGCGIGFKLVQAYSKKFGQLDEAMNYIDLVAISIASDIVPITGENRTLTYLGIEKFNKQPCLGLKALKKLAQLPASATVSDIVFTIGPRINAAGRMDHANQAVALLLSETEAEADELAILIESCNNQRRSFDYSITKEALEMIESNQILLNAHSTVLYKETWSKGVIGIVASRCVENYYRPTVILTKSNGKLTGSARSIRGFNLYEAIKECEDLLVSYGGHEHAAGLTLSPENLDAFIIRFEQAVAKKMTPDIREQVLEIDINIDFQTITSKFFNILNQMEPFGPHNLKPVFVAKDVSIKSGLALHKDKHIAFIAEQKGCSTSFRTFGFNMKEYYHPLQEAKSFNLAFSIEQSTFNGKTSLELRIRDIKFE